MDEDLGFPPRTPLEHARMVFRGPHPFFRLQVFPGFQVSGDGVLRMLQGEVLPRALGLQAV